MAIKLLAVDDEPDILRLTEFLLASWGYEVLTAKNGQEALELTLAEHPDLVLLDVNMDEMNGFEVCERLRARAETELIPVIMLTSQDQTHNKIRGLACADDYVIKTVDPLELQARIEMVLRRVRQTKKAAARTTQPSSFHSCFISHSHKDEEFTKLLHSRMVQTGLRVWYAPVDLLGGRKLKEQIDKAIRGYDKLIVVLSPNSMASNWVASELLSAKEREKREGRQILFPVRLVDFEAIKGWSLFDADRGEDIARNIREYYVPDFSDWRTAAAFERAFEHLLTSLKATVSPPSQHKH